MDRTPQRPASKNARSPVKGTPPAARARELTRHNNPAAAREAAIHAKRLQEAIEAGRLNNSIVSLAETKELLKGRPNAVPPLPSYIPPPEPYNWKGVAATFSTQTSDPRHWKTRSGERLSNVLEREERAAALRSNAADGLLALAKKARPKGKGHRGGGTRRRHSRRAASRKHR